jgi:RND family efflux transporter MFP subunit
MTTTVKRLVGVATAGCLMLMAYPWLVRSSESESPSAPPRVCGKVRVLKPAVGGLARLCLQPATVQSWDIVNQYAQVSGILTAQSKDINDVVARGDLLATIDAPDVVKERDLAKANLDRAEVAIGLAKKQLEATGANLAATQKQVLKLGAQVVAAQAEFDFRTKKVQRFRRLTAQHAIEFRELDREQDEYEGALARHEAVKAALIKAQENEKTWKARVEEARANERIAGRSVEVARAALAKAQVFVDFTQIRAEIDGVITHRSFNNGAYIRAKGQGSQVPLFTIRGTDKFRVLVDIPDMDVPHVRVGDPVYLKIFSLGMGFPGKVDRLAQSELTSSRMMRAEVDLYNDGFQSGDKKGVGKGLLQDGMYGEIAIRMHTGRRETPLLTIPSCCLQTGEDGCKKVFVVHPAEDNTYCIDDATVQVGFNDGERVEILGGICCDDRVVVESCGLITKGSHVELVGD